MARREVKLYHIEMEIYLSSNELTEAVVLGSVLIASPRLVNQGVQLRFHDSRILIYTVRNDNYSRVNSNIQ